MSTQVINTRYEIFETTPGADTAPFVVSKARDLEEGRVVTLQVLPAEALGPGQALREVFQEAVRQAQQLHHSSIFRVYDQGVAENGEDLYVAREYMRGITLQERIRRIAPFTLAVAVDIAVAVAEALVAAHRAGVAHGDLRPVHVHLSPEGQIRIADFAYGAVVADETNQAERAPYLAPELETGETGSFTGDIYALGAILYEMLTGATPPADRTKTPSPRTANAGVPPALDGVTQKALHPELGTRYRTAGALLADLQSVRDALRTGKSLAWSPLAEKRSPRGPAAEATVVAPRLPRPGPAALAAQVATQTQSAGVMTTAAQELDEERYGMREGMRERQPSSALGIATKIMFVVAVLSVIGLIWYALKVFTEVPSDVQVPNLVGRTFDDAKRIAQEQHFTLVESEKSDYSDTWPENQIYEQSPLANHMIKEGKEVTVYLSLGPRLLTVPALVGTTQDYATQALRKADLPLNAVSQEYSETVASGVIIRQSPDQDTKVARNTAVNIVVSKGKQPPDAPADIEADASGPDKAEVTWKAPPRAESYTILRSLDGDVTTVARALTDTHFTDTGLKPETTYSYTVNAVNSAGESGPSESALVTTQALPSPAPILPTPTIVTPDAGTNSGTDTTPPPDQPASPSPATPTARLRQFTIEFRVPRRPRHTRHVQIEIQDTTGTNLVYDEYHQPGESISAPLQGIGHKVTFRVFLDDKSGMTLVKQQTF